MTATDNSDPNARGPRKATRQEAWRERNPQKYWAHAALRSGLRRGLVERQPCEVCDALDTEAHHPDYDRPLVVRWLCRKHHKETHAQEGRDA